MLSKGIKFLKKKKLVLTMLVFEHLIIANYPLSVFTNQVLFYILYILIKILN
jgi:hypothetical protein